MTQGYIFIGVDDTAKAINIECAYALSTSLKLADPTRETCVVVRKFADVPKRYENGFDYIVELPFGRTDANHHDMFIDFWQLYHCTPFDETMFVNTYSLAVDNIDYLWDTDNSGDISFAQSLDFRGALHRDPNLFVVQDKNEINTFNTNMIYFAKNEKTSEFFKMADPVFKGWRNVYGEVLNKYKGSDFDLTLMVNIVAHLLGNEYKNTPYFNYTDLAIDCSYEEQDNWLEQLNVWHTSNNTLKINNYRQTGIVYYESPALLTTEIIQTLYDNYTKAKTTLDT